MSWFSPPTFGFNSNHQVSLETGVFTDGVISLAPKHTLKTFFDTNCCIRVCTYVEVRGQCAGTESHSVLWALGI